MCLLCLDFIKGKLTFQEAMNNLPEIALVVGDQHAEEIVDLLFGVTSSPPDETI